MIRRAIWLVTLAALLVVSLVCVQRASVAQSNRRYPSSVPPSFSLPSQIGNGGKLLGTNGSALSWTSPPAGGLPAGQIWEDFAQMTSILGNSCDASRPPYTGSFSAQAPSRSTGRKVFFTTAATATGVKFFTESPAVSETATCTLWSSAGNTPVQQASGTVVTTGIGLYSCFFSSPFSVTNLKNDYWFMTYSPSGYTALFGCASGHGAPNGTAGSGNAYSYQIGTNIWVSDGASGNGAASPSGGGLAGVPSANNGGPYPVTPIFTVP